MFNGDQLAARYGAKAIAVPGELAGYWEAHQRYGKLAWSDLFQPTIELCDKGSYVNPYIADSIHKKLSANLAEPSLAEILINPQTNSTWITGDRIKRPKLKKTLQLIAEKGIDVFYNGSIGQAIVKEIQDLGGIMQMSDPRGVARGNISANFQKIPIHFNDFLKTISIKKFHFIIGHFQSFPIISIVNGNVNATK